MTCEWSKASSLMRLTSPNSVRPPRSCASAAIAHDVNATTATHAVSVRRDILVYMQRLYGPRLHSGNRPRPGPLLAAIPALLAWTFCAAPALHAQDHAQDPLDIVRRSVERDWTDFSSIQNYTYQERNEFRQYARDGRISNTRSETHEILVLHQRPYQRLIARDGRPLSEAEARKEQAKLDREAEKRAHESPAQRARYERDMADERRFIREIPDAFTFRLERTEPVSGQPAWLIDAEPKPGYRAVTSDAKMFARLRAKIWIEQATFHWVKLDAQALSTLSFGFGLLRVAPGGTLRFEQTRVNDEIWLPSSILVRADARLALVRKRSAPSSTSATAATANFRAIRAL